MAAEKAGTILLAPKTKKIALVFGDNPTYYSFPKGHLEPNETLAECAVRETEEETLRANHLLINQEIYCLTYTTPAGEDVISHYYLAIDNGPTLRNINLDDRKNSDWFSPDEIDSLFTYDNLKEMWNTLKPPITTLLHNDGIITPAILTDLGICPTCYDRKNGNSLYGNNVDKMLFENNEFECFLVGNPRADGHIAISSKKHYKDMMEIPDKLCNDIFVFAKKAMNIIKDIYSSESVYLCTMCDGPMNHFHVQLIPRYSFEKRGSKNFVKPRKDYVEDRGKIEALRNRLNQ